MQDIENNIIIYQSQDGNIKVDVRFDQDIKQIQNSKRQR